MQEVVRKSAQALRSNALLAKLMPDGLDRLIRRRFFTVEYILHMAEREMPAKGLPEASDYVSPYPWKIGIFKDVFFNHTSYVAACRELKVSYTTIDLFASDWVERVRASGCDAFVAWPSELIQEWKRLTDERLRFLTEHLGKRLYPCYDALWLYGCKERMRDWLSIQGFPQVRSWVFYARDEAMAFVAQAELPLVFKLDIGAAASGVWIARTPAEARAWVERVFGKGLVGRRADARARQWRHILIQAYEPDIREWRIIRIGETYVGHEKLVKGDFNSGSGRVGWFAPPREALELIHRVTEAGGFQSMDMDVFQTPDGRFLINELQSVFGAFDTAQMYIDGVPGRYRRIDGDYVFEEGRFCKNACCNLRIEDLIKTLQTKGAGQ
jgi:hypothetical protein